MTGESRYCTGLDEQTCIFGAEGSAARPHGTLQCLFCDPVRLATAVFERDPHVLKRFKLLTAEAQKLALQRTGTDRDRQWLQSRQANAADLAGHDGPLEEELQSLYRRGAELWKNALERRQVVGGHAIAADAYRQRVLEDRAKSLNMFHVPHERLARNAPVSNEDPLPKAKSSHLAANLQLWCEYNSWQICSDCHCLQPRELTPKGLDELLSPWCPPKNCIFCRALSTQPAIHPESTPAALSNLPAEVRVALRPLAINLGPEERARDSFGRGSGYRRHAAMVTFAWQEQSVEDRLDQLNPEHKAVAQEALRWLLQNSGPSKTQTAYGAFYREHRNFLEMWASEGDTSSRTHRRWLRFLEREGVECAIWPDLFWQRQLCLTWVRLQASSRKHAPQNAASNLCHDWLQLDSEDELEADVVGGTKRRYMALVLSPTLDYAASYEILHFTFDLNLWTALGAKRNLRTGVPMRLLMKHHSFSAEYWREMHQALVDLTRQKGYPPLFSTHSPFEWSWPNHCWILDAMRKTRRGWKPKMTAPENHV